jgi:hypothetical protein
MTLHYQGAMTDQLQRAAHHPGLPLTLGQALATLERNILSFRVKRKGSVSRRCE